MHVSSRLSANVFDVVGYSAFKILPITTVVAFKLRYRVGVRESLDLVIFVIRVDKAWIQMAFVDFMLTTSIIQSCGALLCYPCIWFKEILFITKINQSNNHFHMFIFCFTSPNDWLRNQVPHSQPITPRLFKVTAYLPIGNFYQIKIFALMLMLWISN